MDVCNVTCVHACVHVCVRIIHENMNGLLQNHPELPDVAAPHRESQQLEPAFQGLQVPVQEGEMRRPTVLGGRRPRWEHVTTRSFS